MIVTVHQGAFNWLAFGIIIGFVLLLVVVIPWWSEICHFLINLFGKEAQK